MSQIISPPDFVPVPRSERLDAIDFVRGVALLGILLINIATFFGPVADMSGPGQLSNKPVVDQIARLLVNAFCYTKFISIFSMLFGFGLLTQLMRAEAAKQSAWGFAARRLGTLLLFGLVHAIAFWYGDILFFYAMVGVFVVLFRGVPTRPLLFMGITLLVYAALMRLGSEAAAVGFAGMNETKSTTSPDTVLAAIIESKGNPLTEVWIKAETTAYAKGPWQDMLTFRVVTWLFSLVSMGFGMWTLVAGQFLVGMWLYKAKFFAPEQANLRRRVMLTCLPLGLTLEVIAAVFCYIGLNRQPTFWAIGSGIQSFSPIFLPLGYIALFTFLADNLGRLVTPIVSAGRMALTVYLSETLIATTLAYYYGFALFGQVGPANQVLVSFAIWGGLVLFSWGWLRLLPRGPMEALWRLLEYGWGR